MIPERNVAPVSNRL